MPITFVRSVRTRMGDCLPFFYCRPSVWGGGYGRQSQTNTDAQRTTRESVPVERGKSSKSTREIVSNDRTLGRF